MMTSIGWWRQGSAPTARTGVCWTGSRKGASPPASAVWYDLAATVDAVLAVLRLTQGDVEELRIAALVPAAAGDIDAKLDAETATVALYHAQSGGADPYIALGGAQPVGDALVGGPAVAALTAPHKTRWGLS